MQGTYIMLKINLLISMWLLQPIYALFVAIMCKVAGGCCSKSLPAPAPAPVPAPAPELLLLRSVHVTHSASKLRKAAQLLGTLPWLSF